MTRRGVLPALILIAILAVPPALSEEQAPAPTIAYLQVRTLVMDALGTRTVDVSTARVPFNSTGLLMRQVPYGGPPLSFRLLVRPTTPTEDGIRLAMTTEVWSGGLNDGTDAGMERREEIGDIAPDSSYLLELAHERATGTEGSASERRVVLSITVSDQDESSKTDSGPLREVYFVFQMIRQNGPTVEFPNTQSLSSLVGRPVSYSSRSVALGAASEKSPGLTLTLEAEGTQGDLITVRLKVTGYDYADVERSRLAPVAYETFHTVRSGSSFLVEVPVVEEDASPAGKPVVTWVVNVTPRLA
jgi:hypothetical protein